MGQVDPRSACFNNGHCLFLVLAVHGSFMVGLDNELVHALFKQWSSVIMMVVMFDHDGYI